MLGDAKRRVCREPTLNALECGMVVDAVFCAPILETKRHPVNLDQNGVAAVSNLSGSGVPLAVASAVAGIIVYPFQGEADWHVAHVTVEDFEVCPFSAVGDSALPVVLKSLVLRVLASVFHRLPALVCSSARLSVLSPLLILDASTRAYATLFQMIAAYRGSIAAITCTNPVRSNMIRGLTDNGKPGMSFACSVSKIAGSHERSCVGSKC